MSLEYNPEVACVHCGEELLLVESGLICSACLARIIPLEVYRAELLTPVRWSRIRKIGQRAFRKWWGGRESRAVRDAHLASIGLYQPTLF